MSIGILSVVCRDSLFVVCPQFIRSLLSMVHGCATYIVNWNVMHLIVTTHFQKPLYCSCLPE